MRDKSDRYQIQVNDSPRRPKRLGGYLLEAGLLTTDQVDVALNDQHATGMRFGEVLVVRGWLKEKTIEWLMQRVILPEQVAYEKWEKTQTTLAQERTVLQPHLMAKKAVNQAAARKAAAATKIIKTSAPNPPSAPPSGTHLVRRDAPISKPLPPVNSSDSDVSWVG
jgi:hypothetical protein